MLLEHGTLDQQMMKLGDLTMLRACVKSIQGDLFIDLRKWLKFPNNEDFVATKKGIMLKVADWDKACEMVKSVKAGLEKAE